MYDTIIGKYFALKEAYKNSKEGLEEWKLWFNFANRISEYYFKIPLPKGLYERFERQYRIAKALREEGKKVVEALELAKTKPERNISDLVRR